MNHSLSKIKVYKTEDYSVFKAITGNRSLNKVKIDRIVKEIQGGNDVLDEHPILVTEKNNHLEVSDGQHRLEVAKKLGRPVHYIIKEEKMSLYNIAKVNSNVEKWKPIDFINCYAAAGNENYIKLGKFHKKYGIAVGSCLSVLTRGLQSHDGNIASEYVAFEHGTWVITTYKEGVQFVEICKSFEAFSGWNKRGFLIAISKILRAEKCEMDVLVRKFNEDPKRLTYHADWKGFINNLEEIYNKGNSKRRVIY